MQIAMMMIFCVGYLAIACEHPIKINKAASAILTGVLCWVVMIMNADHAEGVQAQLSHHLGELSGILFFLMSAMTVVEIIDAHDGFDVITSRISTQHKRMLLCLLSVLTFFLSSVLDNLTTSIVMVSLLRKWVKDQHERMLFASVIIIAANAGGVWSPIGDVTTTMLWMGGYLSPQHMTPHLFLPSLVSLIVPLFVVMLQVRGKISADIEKGRLKYKDLSITVREKNIVFALGIAVLAFVPIFKIITYLPPYMGILFGLGVLWVVTELLHSHKNETDKDNLSVLFALRKIDMPSILFFLGILLSIAALETAGALKITANFLDTYVKDIDVVLLATGLLSSIVDNVPLVAASMGMYDISTYPVDHYFWTFLAYCAGTGGSILIIGSAAGVAVMGMEKINFFWYLKKISWLAMLGYLSGAGFFMLQERMWQSF